MKYIYHCQFILLVYCFFFKVVYYLFCKRKLFLFKKIKFVIKKMKKVTYNIVITIIYTNLLKVHVTCTSLELLPRVHSKKYSNITTKVLSFTIGSKISITIVVGLVFLNLFIMAIMSYLISLFAIPFFLYYIFPLNP